MFSRLPRYAWRSTTKYHTAVYGTQLVNTIRRLPSAHSRNITRSSQHYSKRNGSVLPATFLHVAVGGVLSYSIWHYRYSTTTFNDAPPVDIIALQQPVKAENPIAWKGMIYPALNLATAAAKLKAEESSTLLRGPLETNVSQFDSVRLPSNNPPEDEKSYGVANVGEKEDWKFWGVYDGHAGWATSKILRSYLTTYVAQSIREARKTSPTLSPEEIDRAIKTGFLNLDNEIMNDGLKAITEFTNHTINHAEAISRIAPARAGSCALLAIYDPTTATLRVACTGDSRAVLGRQNTTSSSPPTSTYTTHPLSVDQTGFNPREITRLATLHPDEPSILDPKSGRLLGFAITRAFGDNRLKWPLESVQHAQSNFYGSAPRPHYNTPPYATAEPEITTTAIQPGDFLILATDGLWDHMSSEHAVECVGMWIEQQRGTKPTTLTTAAKPDASGEDEQRFNYWYKSTPEHFVVEDENAATHLVRNALGGSRRELFCSVMSMQAPDSRNVRDDITVQVVFFGDVVGTKEKEKGS